MKTSRILVWLRLPPLLVAHQQKFIHLLLLMRYQHELSAISQFIIYNHEGCSVGNIRKENFLQHHFPQITLVLP